MIRIVLLLFLLVNSVKGLSQSQVLDKNILDKVHKSLFQYLKCHYKETGLTCLKQINNQNNIIVYSLADSSSTAFATMLKDPYFKQILSLPIKKNTSAKIRMHQISNITFIRGQYKEYDTILCHLGVFPLIKHSSCYYLQIICRTKNINTDELVGYLYLIFDKKFKIIFTKFSEVIL